MKILVGYEVSGRVRDAFRSKGHEAYSCDILPSDSPWHIQEDFWKTVSSQHWDMLIAHPPCTALCAAGNRTYAGSDARMEAIENFRNILDLDIDKMCVENPVGVVSSAIRPPDQYIQPWMFGESICKKTGLWLKGLPKLVPTDIVGKGESVTFSSGKRMSKWYYETSHLPPNLRSSVRSLTFQGIANAMAEQWS